RDRSVVEAPLERLELVVDLRLAGLALEIAEARLDVAGLGVVDHVVGLDLGLELVDAARQPRELADGAAAAEALFARLLTRPADLRRERGLARFEVLELALDLVHRVLHLARGLLLLGGLPRDVLCLARDLH